MEFRASCILDTCGTTELDFQATQDNFFVLERYEFIQNINGIVTTSLTLKEGIFFNLFSQCELRIPWRSPMELIQHKPSGMLNTSSPNENPSFAIFTHFYAVSAPTGVNFKLPMVWQLACKIPNNLAVGCKPVCAPTSGLQHFSFIGLGSLRFHFRK